MNKTRCLSLWTLLLALCAVMAAPSAQGQTYTAPGGQAFTTPNSWNFGAGSFGTWGIPASDAGLALNLQNFGTGSIQAANDLNLTLNTLNLTNDFSGGITLSSLINGDYAFTGAAKINVLGAGSASVVITAPIVFGSGLSSLTLDGAGASALTISGVISSNTSTGAPLIISTDARNAGTGVVTLSGTNTFAGGVVLNTGTLNLNGGNALGDIGNTLTINGGSLRGNTTLTNNITLNNTLKYNGANNLSLNGVLSGTGGVDVRPSVTGAFAMVLQGANTYTGTTTVGASNFAGAPLDGAGTLQVSGAVGSVLNTSSITVRDGASLNLNYVSGASAGNTRVSTSTDIAIQSGFLQIIGHAGIVTQSLGNVTAGGITTIAAQTNGTTTTGTAGTAGAFTNVTVNNLVRGAGATVLFEGQSLGANALATGLGFAEGNVNLTKINGSAPSTALVGGGGAAGSTTMSIIPWALGEATNSNQLYNGGSSFVTYGANGVRLLDTTTEYNISNNFSTAGATENMRVTGAITNQTTPKTVNSVFFASTGQTLGGGSNVLTITSGALASNVVAATITCPVAFGPSGTGEAVISVVDALAGTTNSLTLSGGIQAASLTKSGHGDLTLSGPNTISGGITINGGEISVASVAGLGSATSITVNGSSQTANRAGLVFTHASGTETLSTPIIANSATASISLANAATLQLNSNISGAGGVTYNAPSGGIITVGGTNSYTGPTFITGSGTLRFAGGDETTSLASSAFGSSADPLASFLNIGGGTVQLTGSWTSARAINFSGNATFADQGKNITLSGPITGSGSLFKLGSGTMTIFGTGTSGVDNSYSGTITLGSTSIEGGTLALSGAGALNSASLTFGPNGPGVAGTYVFDISAATNIDPTNVSGTPWRSVNALTTNTSFTQAHTVQLGSTVGAPVDLRVASGTFGQGTAPTGTGVISGFGKLVKVGTGTLTLANPNTTTNSTFTGGVEIWGGTLAFGADNQLGNSSNGITIEGGTLSSTAALTTSRAITLGATVIPLRNNGGGPSNPINSITTTTGLTLSGLISGSGGFAVTGNAASIVNLTGSVANTYTGDTQLAGGTLTFTNVNQLGTGNRVYFGSGATTSKLSFVGTGSQVLDKPIMVAANGANLSIGTGAALDQSGPIFINTTDAFTKTGAGTLTISGNNTSFLGRFIVGDGTNATGNVTLASTGQLRLATVLLSANAATTFDMSGLTREIGSLGNATANTFATGTTVALGTGGSLTTGFSNAAMTWIGNITGDTAAAVTKVGSGALTITSNGNTFGGGFHLLSGASGTTTLSGSGTLPAQSALTLGAWGSNVNKGPLLLLDNTGTNLGTRIDDAQIIHSNAGEIQFSTNTTTPTSETISSLRGAGMTTVTMTTGGTLNFSDATNGLKRINNGTFLFRAGNLNMGSIAANTAVANIKFGNSTDITTNQLIGGGGALGTANISILPYAVGGFSVTDAGSNFVTYDSTFGVRRLNNSTEFQAFADQPGIVVSTPTNNGRFANTVLTTTQMTGGTNITLNSLSIAGTASTTRFESASTEKLILTSGALLNTVANVFTTNAAGTAGVQLGINTAELQTGNGNARELNVFTTGGDLQIGAKVTTSGGLTKSGAANLYVTNTTNSYTGATTINAGSLVIDDKSALGGSTTLQMGGGFLKYRGGDVTLTQSIVAAGGESSNPNGGSAGFHVVSGSTLTAAGGSVSGYGGILKDGTGVLKLTGTNTYSGATVISGGALAINGAAALGTNNRVIFADGISTSGGQTLRFDANNITLTQDFITNTSNATIGFGFDTNGNNATLSGTILSTTSTRGLYKFGAGELNLTATEMYTGATQVFGGTLRLSGANGSILNSTGTGGFITSATTVISPGSALVLDNFAANNNNRLPDVWDTPFGGGTAAGGTLRMDGGEFKLIGNNSGTFTQEKINQLDINFGTITLKNGNAGTQLVSGLLNRINANTTGLIRGDNLGATPSATSTNWYVTDLGGGGVQLNGAGGAEGTPFINILRGFVGDTSATGTGSDLVTYAADTGFRTLAAGEYTSTILANNFYSSRAPNVALTSAATIGQTTAINALKLGTGGSIGGAGTLALFNTSVLATGSASISAPMLSTKISGSNDALAFITTGSGSTLTVDSVIATNALSTYGQGTLLLNKPVLNGSFVILAQGTLKLGANGSLNPVGGNMFVQPGATFDLNGADRTITGLTTTNLPGSFALGQTVDGNVALGVKRLTLYNSPSNTYTGNITGTGGLTKAFFSSGTSTFTQPLAYTGSTVIRAGTLRLASVATLASTAIEVRGGILQFTNTDDLAAAGGYIANRIGTTVPITLAGGGITFTENANAPANHSLGAVTLAGGGTLTITQTSVTAPSTTTIANLIRSGSNTGTLTISATGLGLAQSPTGNARVFATKINGDTPANALIGGGGAVGSTTQSILPWAYGSDGTSNGFITYGADGFRVLKVSEYATTLSGNTTNNVLTSATVTLTADTTANSLTHVSNGPINGAFDLTLTSGALTVGLTSIIGVNTNTLKGGAANDKELFINTTVAATTLNYNLTTTGGVTKFGSSALTLGGTNTFTGGLAINDGAVTFSNDNQLGAAGGSVRLGGAAASPAVLQYTGSNTLAFNRPLETTSFANVTGAAITLWLLNQPITGAGGIGFTTGIFELNATNTYTGPTQLNGGTVFATGDTGFGSGGEILFSGGSLVQRSDWTTSRLIHVSSGSTLNTNGFNTTFTGQIVGAGALFKSGTGNLTLTEAMPSTGTLTAAAGGIILKDRGSLPLGILVTNNNATITLDDRGTHFSDRAADTASLTFGAGNFNLLGNASTTTEEVIATLSLNTGPNTVTLIPGSGQAAILRLATSATTAGSAATLFRGTNLGVNAPGTADTASIALTDVAKQTANAFAVVGGGAPAGNPSISVIKGAFGDINSTGLGTQLVTYDLVKGVRLLDPTTEYTSTLVDGSVVTDNLKVDGTAINLTSTSITIANALWLKDGGSITGGRTLGITSGSLLVTGTGNSVTGSISCSPNVLAIGGPGDLTFNSANGIVTSGGLSKMGSGTLTLNAANTYTGTTWLHSGVINLGNAGAFNTASGSLRFFDGEIRNSSGSAMTLSTPVGIDGIMRIGGAQDLTFSGTVAINSATREINVTNTGVTTISGVVSSNVTNLNYGLTKTGAGLLVLSNIANTYDGPTTVSGGELRAINSSGPGLGKGQVFVNNGGTLAGTGFIIPTLALESLNTITVNSGGILRGGNGTGTGTLTLGSSTTAGVTTATLALGSGSILDFRYSTAPVTAAINTGTSATAGTGSNLVSVLGGLTLDVNALVKLSGTFSDFTAGSTYSFKLAQDTTTSLAGISITNYGNFILTGMTGWTTGVFDLAINGVGNNLFLNLTPNTAAPVVARNVASVPITTGSASNTGTFSDADGNGTVTLTATKGGLPFGTIVGNTGAGTWSWSATGLTSADVGTVTVTATDNSGAVTTTTFAVGLPVPTLTNVTPATGTPAGGTSVTLTGTGFTGASTVTFGGNAAMFTVVSDTSITATTPAHAAGPVSVVVTNGASSNAANTLFTYSVPLIVTSVTPNICSTGGGSRVTLTGSNFASPATVTFGGIAATGVTVVNATTITCTAPAHTAGTVSVDVTVSGQTNSPNTLFTYPPAENAVVTAVSGSLVIDVGGASTAANATVTYDFTTPGGPYVRIHDGGRTFTAGAGVTLFDSHTALFPILSLTSLTLNGGSAGDVFTLNFNDGDFTPPGGINVNGGLPNTSPGDSLVVIGSFSDGTYSTGLPGSGQLDLGLNAPINFTGLEPVDFSSSSITNVTVNIDPGNVYAGNITTTVAAVDAGVNTLISFDAASGLESLKLGTVTGSLTINGDDVGNDYFMLQGLGTAMVGNFTVDGKGGNADVIDIHNTTFTVAGAGKSLNLKADFIGIGDTLAAVPTAPGVVQCSGNITLEANGDSTLGVSYLWNTILTPGVWGIFTDVPWFNASFITPGTVQLRGSIAKNSGGDATLTLKATGDVLSDGKSLSTTVYGGSISNTAPAGKLNVVLNSDSDSLNGGFISLTDGSITTGGGTLTMGGGATPATTYANATATASSTGLTLSAMNINTSGGDVSIRGKGGVGNNNGVSITCFGGVTNGSSIIDSGAGNIMIDGLGGTGTNAGGVRLIGALLLSPPAAAQLKSSTGNITVTGTSRGTSGHGVFLNRSASISSTGTGNITVTGTGTGTPSANSGLGIILTPVASTTSAITSAGGNVTLIADKMNLAGATAGTINVSATSGSVTLKPLTAAVAVNLGSTVDTTVSTLELSTTELSKVTAPTLQIGDSTSGAITVSDVIAPTTYTTLAFGNDVTFAATGGFTSTVPSASTYNRMTVTGTATITAGATFTATSAGIYSWNGTDTFTFLDNDGADAISGTFTGPTLTNFLGSTLTAVQSYAGGSGNDFVIGPSSPTVTSVSPAVGGAGMIVTITGTGFTGATAVTIGGVAVTSFTVVDDSTITATVPTHAAGTADIVVTRSGTGTGTGLFTFVDYVVTITSTTIVCSDVSGHSDTLTVTSPTIGGIKFAVPLRTFSINGAAATVGDSGLINRSSTTSITINGGVGDDVINIGTVTLAPTFRPAVLGFGNLCNLTINGGVGNDTVNFVEPISFNDGASLDVDLQNDDPAPGVDVINFFANGGVTANFNSTSNVTLRASKAINLQANTGIIIGRGTITIEANQQLVPTTGDFSGVHMDTAALSTNGTGGSGAIVIKGRGGNGGAAAVSPNVGLDLVDTSFSSSGAGSLTLNGTSGTGGNSANGVWIQGCSIHVAGDVDIVGNAVGTVTGSQQCGVHIQGSMLNGNVEVAASGSSHINITGTGAPADGGNNCGIIIESNCILLTTDGDITLTGSGGLTGPAALGSNNDGIDLYGGLNTSGTGKIVLDGTAGTSSHFNNQGIFASAVNYMPGSANITTNGGTVTLTGAGNGSTGYGLVLDSSGGSVIDTSSVGADVTLISDLMEFDDFNSSGEPVAKAGFFNSITFKPKTANTTMAVGGGDLPGPAGVLGLSSTDLGLVQAGTLVFGSSTTAEVDQVADLFFIFGSNLQYISGADIRFANGTVTTTGSITITPGTGKKFYADGTASLDADLTVPGFSSAFKLASGSKLAIQVGTGGYDTLAVAGPVDITGTSLVIEDTSAGSYVPLGSDSFTLINSAANLPVTGTFNGLPEGATVSVNGVNKIITYQGGVSHTDVVLVPGNEPPVSSDVMFSVAEDSAASTITLTASDVNMDPLTFTIGTGPTHGILGAVVGNNVSYTPDANHFGTDSFTFKANDGAADSLEATVYITVTPVNDPPVAVDDLLSTSDEDTQRFIPIASLVANDSAGPPNESTQSLTITSVTNAVGGTVNINAGNVEFHPTANYYGPASFDYTVTDNGQSGAPAVDDFKSSLLPGHVSFTINPVNDVPEISTNGPVARISGTGTSTATVAFVSDIETAAGALDVTGFTVPAGITLTNIVNNNGVIKADVGADLGTFPGAYTVVLQVSDGTDTATDSFTVNVSATLLASLSGGSLTIQDASGVNNNITATIVGTDLVFTDANWPFTTSVGVVSNGGHTLTVPLASLTGPIVVNGNGGDDTLTVDLSNGNFIANGLTFNGGTNGAGGDALIILGDDQGTATYSYTNANDGTVEMSNYGTINYTGLEPITNTGTVTDVVFNLPAGGTAATLSNGAIDGDGILRLSGATFETTDFFVPNNSITINTGNASDTLNVTTDECTTDVIAGSLANPFATLTAAAGSLMSPDFDGIVSLYATHMTLSGTILSPGNSFFTARADTLTIDASASITMKTATIATVTSVRVLTVGPFFGALALSDAGLDRIFCSTLNLGDAADTGTILFVENLTRATATTMNVSSLLNIAVDTGKINTGGGNLTLNPGTEVNFQGAPAGGATFDVDVGSNTLSFGGGAPLWRPSIRGTAIEGGAGGYEQLKLKGKITLTGVTLDPTTDFYVPHDGETFVIIDNDGADPVTGIFFNSDGVTPLPQGGYIDNFLGSPLRARITYVGGDGNDVVLTALAPLIDVQQPAGTSLTDGGPAIDFGTSTIGTGVSKTFTIANTGHDDLIITSIDNNGPNAGDFIVGAPGSLTVTPGSSTTFTVTFNPTAAGARADTINIKTNSPTGGYFQIDLTGTGSAATFYTLTSNVDTAHSETIGGATLGTWASLRSGPIMASSGAFAFRAYLNTGGSVTVDDFQGIWKSPTGTSAAQVLAARTGFVAPDTNNALFDVLPTNPTINNNAEVSFMSLLRVNSGSAPSVTLGSDNGVWSEIGGQGLHLLVREGEPITGGTVSIASGSGWIATSDNGYAAFNVKLSTTDGPSSAIVRAHVAGSPSVLSLETIAQESSGAPNLSGGTDGTFAVQSGNSSDPRMDTAGNIAFVSFLEDNRQGIYYQSTSGNLAAVVRTGDTVSGDTFTGLDRPTLSTPTLAFRAFTNNGQSVWKCNPASPSAVIPVARTGDTSAQIPSIPAGSRLWSVFAPFSNSLGHIAFRVSMLDASNNETRAVMSDTGGTLRLIAKPGDAAPGTAGNFVGFDHPAIGDNDQVAFIASTTDGVVGLWRQASGGGPLSLVLKIGQTLSIGGANEVISEILLAGSDSNDRKYETKTVAASGRIMVFLTYDSGKTGVYISTP